MQLERDLHGARTSDLVEAGEAAELGALGIIGLTEEAGSVGELVVDVAEDGVVEDVVSFDAELEADALGDGEVAAEGEVGLHGVEAAGDVAAGVAVDVAAAGDRG